MSGSWTKQLPAITQALLTATLTGAALYVLLSQGNPDMRQWAAGIIGFMLSYWMPGRSR